jgi:hypothetical protein
LQLPQDYPYLFKTSKERYNAPREERIKEMVINGLSRKQAEYYVTLGDKFRQLEKEGIVIDVASAPDLSQQEILSDPAGFRERILDLDPAAIKAALKSPIYTQGYDDVKKLAQKYPKRGKYVVQYPEGSSVEMIIDTGQRANAKAVEPSAYGQDIYWRSANCHGGGPGKCVNASTQWKFTGDLYWAKASVFNLDYTISSKDSHRYWKSETGYYDVGSASDGVVTVTTPNKNTKADSTWWDSENGPVNPYWSQAQGYFNSTLSHSVGGSINFVFASLSLDVNSGRSWTQYVNFRSYADAWVEGIAAYYY